MGSAFDDIRNGTNPRLEREAQRLLSSLGPFDQLRENNHWVPIVYLGSFTDIESPKGTFVLYDRESSELPRRRVSPSAVAKERGLYLAESIDGKSPDMLERLMGNHIEPVFGKIRDKIVYGPSVGIVPDLTTDDRFHLAHYIALQHGRTPANRKQHEWMASFNHMFDLRVRLQDRATVKKEYLENTGTVLSDAMIDEWLVDMDSGKLEIREDGPGSWLSSFLRASLETAEVVFSLPWRVVRMREGLGFPASDMPVVFSRRRAGQMSYNIGGGWLQPDIEVTFALSTHVVLVIGPNVNSDPLVGTSEWHTSVVRRTVEHSNRFVFHRDDLSEVWNWLKSSTPALGVMEYGGRQFSYLDPVGPAVKAVFDGGDAVLRFGPADG